jgi:hypothetical protein
MELIRTEPYDYVYAEEYPNVPELAQPTPANTIWVPWGEFRSGTSTYSLASEGFWDCTGFIFANKAKKLFGLMHAFPKRRLSWEKSQEMLGFRNGIALPVEGAVCTPNNRLQEDLQTMLGIKVLDPLQIDSVADYFEAKPFQLVFRPGQKEILVARNARKDLLVFRGL